MAIGARRARPVRLSVSTGIGRLFTVLNTLAESSLPSVRVKGEPAIYPPLYAEEAELRASIADSLARLAALDLRLDALEA